jgi:multisubunit Na+/H+ antiporter MnhF subunit
MNAYLVAATLLLLGLVPCGVLAVRGHAIDGVVALQAGQTVATLALLLLAQGFHRPVYFSVALTLSVLSFVSGLVFARIVDHLG